MIAGRFNCLMTCAGLERVAKRIQRWGKIGSSKPGWLGLPLVEMRETLLVNEIYLSLQGESTLAGLPCVFIRLTGCPLRCSYCDSVYAFTGGRTMPVAEVLEETGRLAKPYDSVRTSPGLGTRLPLVELTGGEPLAQKAVLPLMASLCDRGYTVLLETSGALDISSVDPRVRRIMDLKCPSSGEVERNRWENLALLQKTDEIKFVLGTWEDYDWAKQQVRELELDKVCPLLFSWAHPLSAEQRDPVLKRRPGESHPVSRLELVERIIADALPVRFQLQMHKVIWAPDQRGV